MHDFVNIGKFFSLGRPKLTAQALVDDGQSLVVAARFVPQTTRVRVGDTIRTADGIPFTAARRTETTRISGRILDAVAAHRASVTLACFRRACLKR